MKKNVINVFIILMIVLVGSLFYAKYTKQASSVLPSVSPSSSSISPTVANVSYCTPQSLQAMLTLDHGAGNVNGTFTIKNISKKQCQIIGNNLISANYNQQTIKNISVMQNDKPKSAFYQLAPEQTIYAKVHYPNGPQCQGPTVLQNITFSYAVSPTDTLTFTDQNGTQKQVIQVCPSLKEVTMVDLWSLTLAPSN